MTTVMALALPVTAGAVRAQEQEPILDAWFEVASVKRNVGGGNSVFRPDPTGAFTVINVPLVNLRRAAPTSCSACPADRRALVDSRRTHDVIAKFDPKFAGRLQPDGHPPTWALAVRRLLVERAQLTFHRETRQLPVHALVMARPDGKLGPNIRPAQATAMRCGCSRSLRREGKPSLCPQNTPTYVPCGLRNAPGRLTSGGFGFAEFWQR